MSTEVMVPGTVAIGAVPEKQAAAWIGLAQRKNELTNHLTAAELQAQMLLVGDDYGTIDANLALYRKAHLDMIETRKEFTNAIDTGIVQPLMAYEKRVDPKSNTAYQTLANRSLMLRKKAEADVAATNAKAADAANFKAHCQNEFHRVCAEYRGIIRQAISEQYAYSLQQKSCVDLGLLKEKLLLVPVPGVNKYTSTFHTGEELGVIYSTIHKPDYGAIYAELMDGLDQTFVNYGSDVANAAAAIEHQKTQAALLAQQEQKTLHEEQALTTLIATSEVVTIDTPKIKRTVNIIVIESEQWAKTIMSTFILNMPHMTKYIRVKSWSKLSIGQMAEYLSKYCTDEEKTLPGLTFETREL